MKSLSIAIAFTVFLGGPAAANCSFQGGIYGVGSVVCAAGGWLQQCNVAGYWSAIGQCNTPDAPAASDPNSAATEVFKNKPDDPAQGVEPSDDSADKTSK